MAFRYLDLLNGVDDVAHDGSSWALAKKTPKGVHSISLAGDTIKCAKTVTTTAVEGTWTGTALSGYVTGNATVGSKVVCKGTVTLESTYTAPLGGGAASNSGNSTRFPRQLTGNLAYSGMQVTFPAPTVWVANTLYFYVSFTAPKDLSAYRYLYWYIGAGNDGWWDDPASATGTLRVHLCSDTAGAVSITSVLLKPPSKTETISYGDMIKLDFGGPMPANVSSIAVYTTSTKYDDQVTLRFGEIYAGTETIKAEPGGMLKLPNGAWFRIASIIDGETSTPKIYLQTSDGTDNVFTGIDVPAGSTLYTVPMQKNAIPIEYQQWPTAAAITNWTDFDWLGTDNLTWEGGYNTATDLVDGYTKIDLWSGYNASQLFTRTGTGMPSTEVKFTFKNWMFCGQITSGMPFHYSSLSTSTSFVTGKTVNCVTYKNSLSPPTSGYAMNMSMDGCCLNMPTNPPAFAFMHLSAQNLNRTYTSEVQNSIFIQSSRGQNASLSGFLNIHNCKWFHSDFAVAYVDFASPCEVVGNNNTFVATDVSGSRIHINNASSRDDATYSPTISYFENVSCFGHVYWNMYLPWWQGVRNVTHDELGPSTTIFSTVIYKYSDNWNTYQTLTKNALARVVPFENFVVKFVGNLSLYGGRYENCEFVKNVNNAQQCWLERGVQLNNCKLFENNIYDTVTSIDSLEARNTLFDKIRFWNTADFNNQKNVFVACNLANNTRFGDNASNEYFPWNVHLHRCMFDGLTTMETTAGYYFDYVYAKAVWYTDPKVMFTVTSHNEAVSDHRVYNPLWWANTTTERLHTAGGRAWKVVTKHKTYEHGPRWTFARVGVRAGLLLTAKLWVYCTNATYVIFKAQALQVEDTQTELRAISTAQLNDWEELQLTYTPTVDGVLDFTIEIASDLVGSIVYLDDFSFVQS